MTDPITSQYDPHPFDPNGQSQDNASSLNLGNTDSPELKVAWSTHPSFNLPPEPISEGGGSGSQESTVDARDFTVGYEALGTQVNAMLTRARGLVTQYEDLRAKVLSTEGTVFGQNSMFPGGEVDTYDSLSHGWRSQNVDPSPTAFAKPAKEFAGHMNPDQQKALQAVGASLELVGKYIALVNHSGQVYAAADRHSKFPEPPPNQVTG